MVTSEISHDISSRCRATNSLTTVTEARSRFSTRFERNAHLRRLRVLTFLSRKTVTFLTFFDYGAHSWSKQESRNS